MFRKYVATKFLNLSHHFLSIDGWPGDATFFLWGQPLQIIRLDLIFDTCASASSRHCFNVCENEHAYSYPFARTNVSLVKKRTLQFRRTLTHFLEFIPNI